MTYVKIPDHLYLDAAMLGVSQAARWTNVAGWMYCSTARTDGFVPLGALGTLGASPAEASELESAGLWVPVPGGWTIVGYLENNRSREEIERISAVRRRAGAIGGKQRGSNLLERGLSNAVAAAGSTDTDPHLEVHRSSSSNSNSKNEANASASASAPVTWLSRRDRAVTRDPALLEALGELGIDDPSALLSEHGDELVGAWLEDLPYRPDLANPAGFLVSRLAAGLMPPPRPAPSASPLQRIIAAKAREFVDAAPPLAVQMETGRAVGE